MIEKNGADRSLENKIYLLFLLNISKVLSSVYKNLLLPSSRFLQFSSR